jgi:hypothetical protein
MINLSYPCDHILKSKFCDKVEEGLLRLEFTQGLTKEQKTFVFRNEGYGTAFENGRKKKIGVRVTLF